MVLGRHAQGRWKPRNLQLVIWQTPLSLLNSSIVMFVVGLTVLVWNSVSKTWKWDDIKVCGLGHCEELADVNVNADRLDIYCHDCLHCSHLCGCNLWLVL
jgi:hypothetical protein